MRIRDWMIERMRKKAGKTICRSKVSALGFNHSGKLVIQTNNSPRFCRYGGGIHAEEKIFLKAKRKRIKTILICRVSKTGNLLPIDPCPKCTKLAEKLGIKIISVEKSDET